MTRHHPVHRRARGSQALAVLARPHHGGWLGGRPDEGHAAQEQVHARAGRPDRPGSRRRSAEAIPGDRGSRSPGLPRRPGATPGVGHAARVSPARVRVQLHARELEGDQRVCVARRADVRQPRHDRCGQSRRGSRRRDGPRAQPRVAAARHRQRDQGSGISNWRVGRRHCRRDRRRRVGAGHQPGESVRSWHVADEVQPRVRETGRPARRADHGAGRLRPARPGAHVRDHSGAIQGQRRSGVDEQPSQPGESIGVHRAGGRHAEHRSGA